MVKEKFQIEWNYYGWKRNDTIPINKNYPHGMSIDFSGGNPVSCSIPIPYPARGMGTYYIKCKECKNKVEIQTCGRDDDPRLVTLACKPIKRKSDKDKKDEPISENN